MRRAVLALVLLTAAVPAASAYHLSVGSQDAVGVEPAETGSSPDVDGELFDRGVRTECPDAFDPSDPTAPGDGFCGRLVYHEDTADLQQTSPTDQVLNGEVGAFDVVLTQYAGTYGLDTCYPWCAPAGTTVFGLASRVLSDAAPDVFTAGADDEDDPGHQSYAVDLRVPHPTTTAPTGAEGSGWMFPTTDPTFVGFLEDDEGTPIDDDALAQMVSNLKDARGGLPSQALPVVCGYSPEIQTEGPTKEAPLTATPTSACDVGFTWQEEGQDRDFGPSGNDRCDSAAYVCGANQPAWYGQLACKGWAGCQAPHEAGDAWHSTGDYDVWHFVVAPIPSQCGGLQDPGFRTDLGTLTGDMAFLAHDLDVYTPVTSSAAHASPAEPAQSLAEDRVRPVVAPVDASARIDPAASAEAASAGAGVPLADQPAYRTVSKPAIPEPNAPGDTSKSLSVERTLGACEKIGPNSETSETADPWVSQIDTIQRYQTWNGMDGTQAEPYLTTQDGHDENNRPGPGFYLSDGKVGLFADVDDDGHYDQAGEQNLLDVQRLGAYPMFHDMRLNDDLEPSGGCELSFANQPIAEAMADAGYGPRTGMVEAIYLKEPTAVADRLTGETWEFPEGNVVFVAQSQSIKVLREAGDATAQEVVQDAIDQTGAPDSAETVFFDDLKDQPSDFWEQCDEETGRYVQQLMVYHDCTLDCSGDTIVTKYLFEVTREDGTLGGEGSGIPAFTPDPDVFGPGTHVWTDVDPFDGDPERNTRDGTPPH